MFGTIFDIAAQAMSVSRLRINTVASNIANANTTRTPEGGPYKRRDVVVSSAEVSQEGFNSVLDRASLKGVKTVGVLVDTKEPKRVYDPGHPDADAQGMVALPDINLVTEMGNLLGASAAYRAAAQVAGATKEMADALSRLSQR